ncbi:MAG: pilus assembly protein PilP [Desulfovermiculus sp.]|nr:pilus assembly protein PilP [Desulfovermiculus sp.]
MTPPAFTYSAKNRVDPFASFIRAQSEAQGEDQNANQALSPLQQVAPTQLKLVGILDPQGGETRLALVELPNGKGYILRPGTLIGRNDGLVTMITEHQVTIEEKQKTPWGEDVQHSVVLELPDSSGVEHDQ